MRDLVIIGTGGVARQAVQIVEDINCCEPTWRLLGLLDDAFHPEGTTVHGVPILGDTQWLVTRTDVAVCVAVGNPASRWRIVRRLASQSPRSYATLVHPSATIGSRSTLGSGTLVYPGVILDTDVTVGNHVILNKTCTIGHDALICEFVTISPGVNIGGAVDVQIGCDLGINSATVQGVNIGEWSILGAGAVVINNIAANTTAVGVPAKATTERRPGWQQEP